MSEDLRNKCKMNAHSSNKQLTIIMVKVKDTRLEIDKMCAKAEEVDVGEGLAGSAAI